MFYFLIENMHVRIDTHQMSNNSFVLVVSIDLKPGYLSLPSKCLCLIDADITAFVL